MFCVVLCWVTWETDPEIKVCVQKIYCRCFWHQPLMRRAAEKSEGRRVGQKEESNSDKASAKLSASPAGSSEAEMTLLSCPILRQKKGFLTPHIYSWLQASPRKVA